MRITLEDRILSVLAEARHPLDVHQIADRLCVAKVGMIWAPLLKLRDEGKLIQQSNGNFAPVTDQLELEERENQSEQNGGLTFDGMSVLDAVEMLLFRCAEHAREGSREGEDEKTAEAPALARPRRKRQAGGKPTRAAPATGRRRPERLKKWPVRC